MPNLNDKVHDVKVSKTDALVETHLIINFSQLIYLIMIVNWKGTTEKVPVVQRVDSAIQRINHYPLDKYYQSQLSYPVDIDSSSGQCYPPFLQLMPGD